MFMALPFPGEVARWHPMPGVPIVIAGMAIAGIWTIGSCPHAVPSWLGDTLMQTRIVLPILLAGLVAAAEPAVPSFRFTRADLGKTPAGWKAARSGKGEGSIWKVLADETAPSQTGLVLAQTAAGPNGLFNLCVADEGAWADVDVEVAFKAIRGVLDQGGGIVWRYQDANNYSLARMNPLESNYHLYMVSGGVRTQLATKEDVKVPAREWHRLRIRQTKEQITCWLDGKKLLQASDRTFTRAGKIGLWTKADAQTYFDDLRVRQP
jgi:hypothetical protein